MMFAADSIINFRDRSPIINNLYNSFNMLLKIETCWGKKEKVLKDPENIEE